MSVSLGMPVVHCTKCKAAVRKFWLSFDKFGQLHIHVECHGEGWHYRADIPGWEDKCFTLPGHTIEVKHNLP